MWKTKGENLPQKFSLSVSHRHKRARAHTHTHTHTQRYASDQYGNFLSRQKNNLVANSSTRTV